jgi:hypothetical protein
MQRPVSREGRRGEDPQIPSPKFSFHMQRKRWVEIKVVEQRMKVSSTWN